jgi:hypothetical protein
LHLLNPKAPRPPHKLVHNGYVLVEIMNGMNGLPQFRILAYEQIVANIAKHGYTPGPHTLPGVASQAVKIVQM